MRTHPFHFAGTQGNRAHPRYSGALVVCATSTCLKLMDHVQSIHEKCGWLLAETFLFLLFLRILQLCGRPTSREQPLLFQTFYYYNFLIFYLYTTQISTRRPSCFVINVSQESPTISFNDLVRVAPENSCKQL